jgi:hypothetical protein
MSPAWIDGLTADYKTYQRGTLQVEVVEREAVAGRRWCFGYRCFALRFVTFLIS